MKDDHLELKIINIGHVPPRLGGSGLVNREIVEGLRRNFGHYIRVISHGIESFQKEGKLYPTIPETDIPVNWFIMEYLPAYKEPPEEYIRKRNGIIMDLFSQLYEESVPDVVMVGHECYAWPIAEIKTKEIPVALIIHGTPTHGLKDGIYSPVATKKIIDSYKEADVVVAVSHYLEDIANDLGVKNTTVIHNATDTELFKPESPKKELKLKLEITDNNPVISHYSNLRPVKRINDLVESAKVVRQKFPNVIYLVVGNGPCKDEAMQIVKDYNLEDNFRFVGKVPHDEVPDYINLSDIIVSTSEKEGFGRIIREGQACGKIVIASQSGPTEELIDDNNTGFIYNVGDIDALSELCINVLEGRFDKEKIGRRARKVAEEFNLKNQIKSYDNLLRKLSNKQQ